MNLGFPIHWWRGKTGRLYPHTVFPLGEVPWVPEANFVLASMGPGGTYEPVYVGATENLADTMRSSPVLPYALRLGATHIHVHLLADSPQRRLEVQEDLLQACEGHLRTSPPLQAAS